MNIFSPDAVKRAEDYLINERGTSGLGLMKKAAFGMYSHVRSLLGHGSSVCVLCGKGNNAGDGYELARLLLEEGFNVMCVRAFGEAPCTEIAFECYNGYISAGGKVIDETDKALRAIAVSDVVIDAVFGIGFRGQIEKDSILYKMFDVANKNFGTRIALDVPSGVNGTDGSVGNIALRADITLTVSVIKTGMLSYPAKKYCGEIRIIDIGIQEQVIEGFGGVTYIPDDEYVREALPKREVDSNKGDFGKLLCICGSENMTGAAVLAVGAALRSGVGLVTLASEKSVTDVVKCRYPEPIYRNLDFNDESTVKTLLDDINVYSAVLIGCGFSKSHAKRLFLEELIKRYSGRLIIDADGINMLSDNINILKEARADVIITPHPGEFARISGVDTEYINENRIKCARDFAASFRCVTVLKGAGTVVADKDSFSINTTGNPGLAKGGSGDVLAGLIAGLAANKKVSVFDAAICGVYIHGKAADVLKEKFSEYGLLPSDLAEVFAGMLP